MPFHNAFFLPKSTIFETRFLLSNTQKTIARFWKKKLSASRMNKNSQFLGYVLTTSRGSSILSNTSLKVCNACKSLKMFLFKIEKKSKINPKINLKIPKKKTPKKIGSDLLTSNRSTYRHPWFRPRRDLKTLQNF